MEKEAGLCWKEAVFVGCLLIKFRKRAVGKLWKIALSGGAERVGGGGERDLRGWRQSVKNSE